MADNAGNAGDAGNAGNAGNAGSVADGANGAGVKIVSPDELRNIPRPTRSAQPNCLVYSDDQGVQHRIYLPQGTMKTAVDHLQNKRWDELAKFEPYTNQGYKEEDYVTIN